MSQGASRYPISRFLYGLLEECRLTRSEFVGVLGYRDVARGRRRLDPWLDQGLGYQRILEQIAAAYPGHAGELQRAAAETAKIKAAEAEAAFLERCKAEEAVLTPFIHAEGERSVPSGITIFGITGGHRRWTTVQIPQTVLALPLEDQLALLPDLMAGYRRLYSGQCPFFGRLTGFKFVRVIDYFQFDSGGRLLEHVPKPFRHGGCWVEPEIVIGRGL